MQLYPTTAADKFELGVIKRIITGRCSGDAAKLLVNEMQPMEQGENLLTVLEQTDEMLQIRKNGLFFPQITFPNIGYELNLLGIPASVLEAAQFAKLRITCEIANNVIRFLKEKQLLYPKLALVAQDLLNADEIIKEISAIIDENALVKSSASKKLGEIRKSLAEARNRANRLFEQQIKKFQKAGYLREFNEGYYNDRRVLAVLAEYKRQIGGIIHGSSDSGRTSFVEPGELVEINNLVQEYEQDERKEIYRVLTVLTNKIRTYHHQLRDYEKALSWLEFTDAKAAVSNDLNCILPQFSNEGVIDLREAVHPVLFLQNRKEGKKTIPLNLKLEPESRLLVISGPNAGGKSISLKTLGLHQIMLQSGMLVPVKEGSTYCLFDKLFVDMGDDQSIAYELSTYSSRLVNMKHFITLANAKTLIFIDEFGTGSDPDLGGAIAESILEVLAEKNCYGIITTHYNNIKLLAEEKPGLMNASMLFNLETLSPLYVLSQGQAGSSYTFEVAKKIGLPNEILDDAKKRLNSKQVKFDKVLVTVQTKKNELNREIHRLQEERGKLRKELEDNRKVVEKITAQEEQIKRADSLELIAKGEKYDKLIALWSKPNNKTEVYKRLAQASVKEKQKEEEKLKQDVVHQMRLKKERLAKQKQEKKTKEGKKKSWHPTVGEQVRLKGGKELGEVLSVDNENITVAFGILKTKVQKFDLQPAQ
ncbi:MAG: endonuclease MutS2 [Luteibaculaceae bacterium]